MQTWICVKVPWVSALAMRDKKYLKQERSYRACLRESVAHLLPPCLFWKLICCTSSVHHFLCIPRWTQGLVYQLRIFHFSASYFVLNEKASGFFPENGAIRGITTGLSLLSNFCNFSLCCDKIAFVIVLLHHVCIPHRVFVLINEVWLHCKLIL